MAHILRDNPVFWREARWWYRLHWLRKSKSSAWTGVGIVLVFGWLYVRVLWSMGEADIASFQPLWLWITNGLLLIIVLLGPTLASASIIKEREQRTWENLALTQLLGREIILGKWFASLVPIWLLILVATPLLLLLCAGLGTSIWEAVLMIIFYLMTAAAYTLLGLLCSFLARKASVARMTALIIALSLCFGLFIVDSLFRSLFVPEMRGYSPLQTLFPSPYGYSYRHDYGYSGLPAFTWLSPFFVLFVLSTSSQVREYPFSYNAYGTDFDDVWSAQASSVLLIYSISLVLAISLCLYYMLTRYRRDVRGGRPLGETIS